MKPQTSWPSSRSSRVRSLLAGGVLVALALGHAPAAAQGSPRASARCRTTIAKAMSQLIAAGLRTIDACHRRRDRGKFSGDCNDLGSQGVNSAYSRVRARADVIIPVRCTSDDPVLDNYPGRDVKAFLFREIPRVLERSGSELQGAPLFVGDRASVKALGRCHNAVGAGRTAIVTKMVGAAAACQRRLDKRAQAFGALDPSCVADPARFSGGPAQGIQRKCGSFSGLDVGSCATLPGCVVEGAGATGELLARGIYGALVCGNGEIDFGEECDDGNTDAADGCTSDCRLPSCGDGVVQVGVEECDDGNDIPNDACNDCRLATCGDGIVAEGIEECDDGNATANDGCTDCEIDPLTCGSDGVDVTVDLDLDPTEASVSAFTVQVSYPSLISVPGSASDPGPTAARVTNLAGTGLFLPTDLDLAPVDGIDDTLRTLYSDPPNLIPPGAFERIRFDCEPGGVVRPRDFPCTVTDVADPFGDVVAAPVGCLVSLIEPVGAQPTTTTLPTATTTSTTLGGPTTTSTSSTTTTTMPSALCGNGVVDGDLGETCDDGNTVGGDSCPANCRIEPCTPVGGSMRPFTVHFTPPGGLPPGDGVAGLTIFLDYPEGQVIIPGSGGGVSGSITPNTGIPTPTPNDLDYAIRVVISSGAELPTTQLMTIAFEDCQGAPAPTPGSFSCTVESAADGLGFDINGVTCNVQAGP